MTFDEWINERMGRENFESEPMGTQTLVADAFAAGAVAAEKDRELRARRGSPRLVVGTPQHR